jgi:hypothetical protein
MSDSKKNFALMLFITTIYYYQSITQYYILKKEVTVCQDPLIKSNAGMYQGHCIGTGKRLKIIALQKIFRMFLRPSDDSSSTLIIQLSKGTQETKHIKNTKCVTIMSINSS